MSQVRQLYKLQQIDSETQEKKQRLGEVIRAQKETGALLAARRRAETAASELRTWQTRHNDLNLELGSLSHKAKRSEDRLYSGTVKNPKELADLQKEIESLGRRRAALEDEVLEAMIMVEDAEAEKSAAGESLARTEAEWKREQAGLKQEQNELALRLHTLAGWRREQLGLIAADSLAEYERVGRRKGGVAVAALKNNICSGCQMSASAQKVKDAREGKLVNCGGCGRILYPV